MLRDGVSGPAGAGGKKRVGQGSAFAEGVSWLASDSRAGDQPRRLQISRNTCSSPGGPVKPEGFQEPLAVRGRQ